MCIRDSSFCLMTNHIHLIIETPEGGLSQALHLIESTYVQGFNRRYRLDGPLLKGRFYSRLILDLFGVRSQQRTGACRTETTGRCR